jgi:hypothetical protein
MATFETLQQVLVKLERVEGVTAVDIMKLPSPLDATLKRMLKEPLSLTALASALQLPAEKTRQLADLLVEKGFIKVDGQDRQGDNVYRICFARTRKLSLPDGLF